MAQTSLIRTRAKYTCQTIGRCTFGPVADSAVPPVEAALARCPFSLWMRQNIHTPVFVGRPCAGTVGVHTVTGCWYYCVVPVCTRAHTILVLVCAKGQVCVIFEVLRGTEMLPSATKLLRAAVEAGERKRREEGERAAEEERAEIRMAEEIASISW